jgi:hypothetical protein
MKEFIPTDEDKFNARESMSLGISADYARLEIKNPQTKKPIDLDTFCKAFSDEIKEAKLERAKRVVSTLFEKACMGDVQAISKYLTLCCRGVFDKKFDYDDSLPPNEQIGSIIKAASNGLIGSMEAESFINGIAKKYQLIEFEEIKKEWAEIKRIKAEGK